MKLYAYDHCPFCVRARMIFGLKNLPMELIFIDNDDEATPVGLVGKKVVPILVKDDGSAMPESLDIVRYVDQLDGNPIIADSVRPEVETWTKKLGAFYNHLLLPRFVKLDLAEFQKQSAIDYFVHKKRDFIGDFDENLANSARYIEQANALLSEFADFIKSEKALNGELNGKGALSLEDITVFPMLRNLTCVKGVIFPQTVKDYLHTMSTQSGVNLFFDKTI